MKMKCVKIRSARIVVSVLEDIDAMQVNAVSVRKDDRSAEGTFIRVQTSTNVPNRLRFVIIIPGVKIVQVHLPVA